MAYTVHQAKTQFSRLLREAEAGKEVIVTRGKKPVARIVPIEPPPEEKLPFRLLGAYRGKISWTEDALAPLTDQELTEMGWGYMTEAPPLEKPKIEKPRTPSKKK